MAETKIVSDRLSDTLEFEFNELALGNGSVGAPSLAFTSDQTTGLFRVGASNIGMALGGALAHSFTTAGLTINTPLDSFIELNAAATGKAAFVRFVNFNGTTHRIGVETDTDAGGGAFQGIADSFNIEAAGTAEIAFSNNSTKRWVVSGNGDWAASDTTVRLLLPDGAVGDPAMQFSLDANTGIYRSASDNLSIAAGGLQVAIFASTNCNFFAGATDVLQVVSTGTRHFVNGSAAEPSIHWSGDTDTGIFHPNADQITLVAGGTNQFNLTSSSVRCNPAETISIGSDGNGFSRAFFGSGTAALPSYTFSGDANTGMFRSGADVLNFATAGVLRWTMSNPASSFTGSSIGDAAAVNFQVTNSGTGNTTISANGAGGQHILGSLGSGATGAWWAGGGPTRTDTSYLQNAGGGGGWIFINSASTNAYFNSPTAGGQWIFSEGSNTNKFIIHSNGAQSIDGSASLPSYSFINDPDLGMYRLNTNHVALSCATSGNISFVEGGVEKVRYDGGGDELGPQTDNAIKLGDAARRWSDVRSVLINGADYGFENGYILREYPATYDDVQNKSPQWMKENANKGIQILNDEGEQVCIIGRNGKVYANGFGSLEEAETELATA